MTPTAQTYHADAQAGQQKTLRLLTALGIVLGVFTLLLTVGMLVVYQNNHATQEQLVKLEAERDAALAVQLYSAQMQSRQLAYLLQLFAGRADFAQATEAHSEFVSARNALAENLPSLRSVQPGSALYEHATRLLVEFDKFLAADTALTTALSKAGTTVRDTNVAQLSQQAQLISAGISASAELASNDARAQAWAAANAMDKRRSQLRTVAIALACTMLALLSIGKLMLRRYAQTNKRLLTELEQLSMQDPLTGCANRRAWNTAIKRELNRTRYSNHCLSVAELDLDFFKQYNDQYGHAQGDALLKRFVECAQGVIGPNEMLARLGGEEFAVLIPNARASELALRVDIIRHAFSSSGSFSAGITESLPGDTVDTLFARADAALYDAKRNGRNCSVVVTGAAKTSAQSGSG
jgi:diguanylate cyclase (GGDEF)-like protein